MIQPTGTVLVVDDDKLNRTILANQLELEGHTVIVAEQGRRAIELLSIHEFDVVLLDLLMPDIDGFTVLERIRADTTTQHLPVIVISALDEMESVVRSIRMGATDHLVKPCNPFILRARINASLTAKRLRDKETAYLQQVACVIKAAADLEAGTFNPERLDGLAKQQDALGKLARVFQRMAREVSAREYSLQQQSAFKSALIGKITHELRSPFVAAALSVQVLQRYVEHNMISDLPDQIHTMERLLTEGRVMIDRIITFASLVGKQAVIQPKLTDMALLIHDIAQPLEQLATVRQIRFVYDIAPDLPPVLLDQVQVSEAIQHLVHNAIKFTQPAGRISVRCHVVEQKMVFAVEDTGCGIESDKMQTIWGIFNQTSDDVQRGMEGLGLGLALVKYVVEAHGGTPLAQSKLGSGSTFGFALPLAH